MPRKYVRKDPKRKPTLSRKIRVGLRSLSKRADSSDEWQLAAVDWIERTWKHHERMAR